MKEANRVVRLLRIRSEMYEGSARPRAERGRSRRALPPEMILARRLNLIRHKLPNRTFEFRERKVDGVGREPQRVLT